LPAFSWWYVFTADITTNTKDETNGSHCALELPARTQLWIPGSAPQGGPLLHKWNSLNPPNSLLYVDEWRLRQTNTSGEKCRVIFEQILWASRTGSYDQRCHQVHVQASVTPEVLRSPLPISPLYLVRDGQLAGDDRQRSERQRDQPSGGPRAESDATVHRDRHPLPPRPAPRYGLSKLYDGEKCPYVTFLTKYGIIDYSDKCPQCDFLDKMWYNRISEFKHEESSSASACALT
jgi:hypothetical protein